mmetsp:Transcript_26384/g.39111  ORF Transcript_26384/g.39111 Transcript_26384/m.39111 type:complete len:247 (-) Transcript_26384:36-776(-)
MRLGSAYNSLSPSSPFIFSSMIPFPTKLRSLYTAESGRVTVPDDTTTRRGIRLAMQHRAAFSTPSRSTLDGSPPLVDADAANMTAPMLLFFEEITSDRLEGEVTSAAATESRFGFKVGLPLSSLYSKSPFRLVAMQGRLEERRAFTHSRPVPPPAPSTTTDLLLGTVTSAVDADADGTSSAEYAGGTTSCCFKMDTTVAVVPRIRPRRFNNFVDRLSTGDVAMFMPRRTMIGAGANIIKGWMNETP